MMHRKKIFFLIYFLIGCSALSGQQIQIDRGVRAAGLWCFPLLTDSLTYLYLPAEARLGNTEKNQPQFSFLRYVINEKNEKSENNSITSAAGGAVLNFLVLYETPEKKVREAQEALKEIRNSDNVKLRGPVIFSAGRYALISSIINEYGSEETKVLATGNAPVLEGSRIALSFELTPAGSKILMESFKMTAPDISIVFDMAFSGLTDAYQAELVVNWDDVRKSEAMNASANVYFVGADVEKSIEELRRNNSVKLITAGSDANMEGLVNTVYSKLVDLLFQQIDPEKVPPRQQAGLSDLIGSLIKPKGSLSSSKIFGFGLNAGYKLREFKSTGKSVMSFNSRTSVERHHLIAFNIGDFYKKYGDNPEYFKTISMDDPDFQQREIYVSIDGTILPEFDKMINNITVTLRKTHENGEVTLKELNITKNSMNENKPMPLTYGSISDKDRDRWMWYEYKTNFQFMGGKSYETPWISQTAAMINVYAPYERRTIQLDGDPEKLKQENIRAVTVQVDYPFFSDRRKPMVTLKPTENIGEKKIDITLPVNEYEYGYEINWILNDGNSKTMSGKNTSGILFIDNIPN